MTTMKRPRPTSSRRRIPAVLVAATAASSVEGGAGGVPLASSSVLGAEAARLGGPRRRQQRRRDQQGLPHRQRVLTSPQYFPNWSDTLPSGGNVCLSSSYREPPSYMLDQGLMKATLAECCEGYYWFALDGCAGFVDPLDDGSAAGDAGKDAEAGDGGAGEEEGGWVASHADFKCVPSSEAEVVSSTFYTLGGRRGLTGDLSSSGTAAAHTNNHMNSSHANNASQRGLEGTETVTHADAEACCLAEFPYLVAGACAAESEGADYGGTMLFYAEYAGGRCVQDCSPATLTPTLPDGTTPSDGICGGIVRESGVPTYDDAASCCAVGLSYVDGLLCETRSSKDKVQEGTFRLYPDATSGTCVIDQDPSNAIVCGIGYDCRPLPSTTWASKLYPVSPAGVQDCCASPSLPGVNPTYCATRTMGIVSRKWYADYNSGKCLRDCDDEGQGCRVNLDAAASYHDTAAECCAAQLGYRNKDKCVADSEGTNYAGTQEYYVNYAQSKCVQDCPEEDGAGCGGVVGDSGTRLHEDAATCCRVGLSYMSQELCEDRTDPEGTGTGRYYPSVGDGTCVKDTPVQSCPSDETCGRVDGWVSTLYPTPQECCASDAAAGFGSCVSSESKPSNEGAVVERYYVDWIHQRCVKNCPENDGDVECGGLANQSWMKLFDDVEECCGALHYIDRSDCVKDS